MIAQLLWMATLLAADPVEEPAGSRQLRQVVSQAMRREATTQGADHEQAVRDLVAVYRTLQQDQRLPERERRQRTGQVQHRLKSVADLLERHTGANSSQPARAAAPAQRGATLAQALSAPGGLGGRAAGAGQQAGTLPGEAEQAQQLIDLIQTTIAPDTWDVRGGPGTAMYFPPSKVLVIRQTSEVHGQVRDLSRQLRRN
ncbi:MAG: hypothetical protein WD845_07845 [Pirellulales bacterium]